MKLYWNKETKRLAVIMVSYGVILLTMCNLVIAGYRAAVRREYNQAAAALIGGVMETYPEASEEDLIRVLNGKGPVEDGEKILARYGIFSGDSPVTVAGRESSMNALQLYLNLLLSILLIALSAVFFCYLSGRRKRISTLCRYMEELSRGNYELDIQNNADDELSGLKNELYKLTVLFREQARQAMKNRRALADSVADISHQIKTPLASVTVLVDNLSENENMDQITRRRFVAEISKQLSGITWLVSTLLKLSKLDAGVICLEKEPLKAGELAQEVCAKLELNAEWHQVTLRADIPETVGLSGDRKWLSEALLNIVKNAIEHSPAESTVRLAAEENDLYTLLTVHNSGDEIPPEEQKHLFERFYRSGPARADSVGIGLALAKEIIVRQGGYITVESEREKGTTFVIKFLKIPLS